MNALPRWLRLLSPFSLLYSAGASAKAWAYARGLCKRKKLAGTVISVGNLTVGGTGKTPMVLWVAQRLAREGKHVAVLTRGYRGTSRPENGGEPQSDEIVLLRQRLGGKVQLGVGANRFESGAVLSRHGIDWFVLDDGFQHLKLARDADVVLIDATNPFGGGRTLPAGPLREPVSALARADLIVITRSLQEPSPGLEKAIRRHTKAPIFYASTRLDSVLRLPRLDVALPERDWREARFYAFCGIGNPQGFFEDLRGWAFRVVGRRSFFDHHVYSAHDAQELEHSARQAGADVLLCTEKDVWNLRNVQFTMPVYCCRISFELSEEFWQTLMAIVRRTKPAVAQ